MKSVVLFGGTTEGRQMAEFLAERGISTDVFVVSQYGADLLPDSPWLKIHVGRLDASLMMEMLERTKPAFVLDATHPYASEVTRALCQAAGESCLPYIRICREETEEVPSACVSVADVKEAVLYMAGTEGDIFLTTGTKELKEFSQMPHFQERCYVRALPSQGALDALEEAGVDGKHRILMQGPFSEELNYALFRETKAAWLVTKVSGKQGGFGDKCEAAVRAGMHILVIGRPKEDLPDGTTILTLAEAKEKISHEWTTLSAAGQEEHVSVASYAVSPAQGSKDIYLVGMGPGSTQWVSPEAQMAVFRCGAICGSRRMLELAGEILPGDPDEQKAEMSQKAALVTYKKEEMRKFVDDHPGERTFAFLFSGDIRVYSGAEGMEDLFPEKENFHIHRVEGMSSVTYFAQKLHLSTDGFPEEAVIVSFHGREEDLVSAVRDHRDVFVLLGGQESLHAAVRQLILSDDLPEAILPTNPGTGLEGDPEEPVWEEGIRLVLGERLSYEDEKITEGRPADFLRRKAN